MRTPRSLTAPRRPAALRVLIGVFAILSAPLAAAQERIQQDGRLFDANPSLSAGRYNGARPISPLLGGNAVTGGVAGGGFSFRGFAPINDPNTFRAPLGSGALSNFRRDSFSVADSLSPYRGLLARPYYDADTTAPTAGFLQGRNPFVSPRPQPLPGTGDEPNVLPGPLSGAAPLDMRIDPRLGGSRALRSGISGLPPAPRGELGSSIFGPQSAVRPTPAAEVNARLKSPVVDLAPRPWKPSTAVDAVGAADVPRLPGTSVGLGTPADLALRGDATSLLLGNAGVGATPVDVSAVPLRPGALETLRQRADAESAMIPPPRAPRIVDPSVLPGRDVFTDMRLALALQRDPQAEWFVAMRDAIRSDPTLANELFNVADMQAAQFVESVVNAPVRTFVGRDPSLLNSELLKAESQMELGQYFDAAARYEKAQYIDPANPLPVIGRAHALLAAGEYQSAALFLVRGLERFPELTRFRIDLTELLGGGEIVDIRRSDLRNRLAARDDPHLRFLLGYLEYQTGSLASGMAELEKAAAAAGGASIIGRYPAMLRGEGVLPPPRLGEPDPPPTANSQPAPAAISSPTAPPPADSPPKRDDNGLTIPPPVTEKP